MVWGQFKAMSTRKSRVYTKQDWDNIGYKTTKTWSSHSYNKEFYHVNKQYNFKEVLDGKK